jgi:hypothetical protein
MRPDEAVIRAGTPMNAVILSAASNKLTITSMILDEKNIFPPPPPYLSTVAAAPPPFNLRTGPPPNLHTLPAHILLQIVYSTFPQTSLVDQDKPERQRKTLYWLAISFRLVNRALYVACMHVLRSTYLPSYDSLIRPPYSSDPFPLSHSTTSPPPSPSPSSSTLQTIQRETATLDLFIALKVREDVWADESELHLERDESFKDLFDLVQPRSRLEDLVRNYGLREGVISLQPLKRRSDTITPHRSTGALRIQTQPPPPPQQVSSPLTPSSSFFSALSAPFSSKSKSKPSQILSPSPFPHPHTRQPQFTPLLLTQISVSFSPRKVGLVLHPGKRTIVETTRTKEEKLEVAAKRLVKELKVWLIESG